MSCLRCECLENVTGTLGFNASALVFPGSQKSTTVTEQFKPETSVLLIFNYQHYVLNKDINMLCINVYLRNCKHVSNQVKCRRFQTEENFAYIKTYI